MLADSLVARVKFAKKRRPDLVCFDNRRLQPKQGLSPTRLFVVEFKRPGVTISTEELSQVMLYKTAFETTVAAPDGVEVLILGDKFDAAFDRQALAGQYNILSYEELLANARDRYRDLYEKLAPDGIPEETDDKAGASILITPSAGAPRDSNVSNRRNAGIRGAKSAPTKKFVGKRAAPKPARRAPSRPTRTPLPRRAAAKNSDTSTERRDAHD